MISKKLSVAILGVGFGERAHLPAFSSHPRCRVAVVCASRLSRAREVAARHRIPDYSADWRSVVKDATVDIVSVAAPPALQAEIAAFALRHHKHLFLEKPLTATFTQARSLARLARRSKSRAMIDFEFAELPAWKAARDILRSGKIGRVRHVCVSWNVETYANKAGLDNWKTRLSEGGGTLSSFTSHVFYYLEELFGPIERLSADLSRFRGAPGDADTANFLRLSMRSGCAISVAVSAHSFAGSGHRLEIYGDKGRLFLENLSTDYAKGFRLYQALRPSDRAKEVVVRQDFFRGFKDGRVPAVTAVVKRFVNAIETGHNERPDLASGIRVQKLIECARKSNRLRREIKCA